jgi:hypothetical protein
MESYVERPPLPGLARVVRTVWIQRTGEAAYVQRHLSTGGVEIHFSEARGDMRAMRQMSADIVCRPRGARALMRIRHFRITAAGGRAPLATLELDQFGAGCRNAQLLGTEVDD